MKPDLPEPRLMCSAKPINGKDVHVLRVNERWRQIIEPVTMLKERLDRVLNSNAWNAGEVTSEDVEWAKREGFDLENSPSGTGVCPVRYARWIVGSSLQSGETMSSVLTRVPSWSAIGWRRRRHAAKDEADARSRRARLDTDTAAGNDGTGDWLQPLPLVICGEGKHRAQMHALYFTDMLVNLRVQRLPATQSLRLRRVLGAPRLLALQHRKHDGRWMTSLLPFPELSQPLFEAIGVREPRGWWIAWPWHDVVRQVAAEARWGPKISPWWLFLGPSKLRSALLRSGYV